MYFYLNIVPSCLDLIPSGWSDSAFNDTEDGRSTQGFALFIGKMLVSWKSKSSQTVAQSTFESDWVAINYATSELIWVSDVLCNVLSCVFGPSMVHTDNKACIDCGDDCVVESNKHFNPKYFLVVKCIHSNVIALVKVGTDSNLADNFTKALGNPAFLNHCKALSLSWM